MSGTLYVVATPIGNLEDITLRAVRILREADGVLAEDTRHTGRLLKHLGVETRMTSLHGHNEKGRPFSLWPCKLVILVSTPRCFRSLPVCRVSSAKTPSASRRMRTARSVMSSRFPMGVATT